MMKGGKEEDKIMGPLFPRLHVNDAEKAGPRAPPRNKMALYEQLSIPSHRFNTPASSALLTSPFNAGTLALPATSSQGGGHERSVLSSFSAPQSPSNLVENVQSLSSDGKNPKFSRMEFGRSTRHANYKSSNVAATVAECSLMRTDKFSSAKNSCKEKLDDDNDFRVPTFLISEVAQCSTKDTKLMEEKRLTPLYPNNQHDRCLASLDSSIQVPDSYDNHLEQTDAYDTKLTKNVERHTVKKTKETVAIKEHIENSVSHLDTGKTIAEASNYSKASPDQESIKISNVIDKTHHKGIGECHESYGNGALAESGCLNVIDVVENGDALRVRSESCAKESFANSSKCKIMADNQKRETEDMAGTLEHRNADRTTEVSDTSMLDSISSLDISPDDVVGIIGQKQFWKARRAIVNQQRIFAVQVFELHRLIKVQKLIAASPHLLHDGNHYLSGSPQMLPDKNLAFKYNAKPQLHIARSDDTRKLNQSIDCRAEHTRGQSLPSHDDDLSKEPPKLPSYESYSGNPSHPVPVAPDNKSSAWCYPPANHWLIPVISPSEGLIYKPYTGPCPPPTGLLAPVYESCASLSLPPAAGGFMSAAYVPSSHKQHQNMTVLSGAPSNAYFPMTYSLHAMKNISASAVELASPMTGVRHSGQIEQHSRSSSNMAIPSKDAYLGRPWKINTSKDSELQGSTASSPCEGTQGDVRDALPLFPMAPAAKVSTRASQDHNGDLHTRVIKVVPHNAKSATVSAARIFQSIQEERQRHESL